MFAYLVGVQSRDESEARAALFPGRRGAGCFGPNRRPCCTGTAWPRRFIVIGLGNDLLARGRRRYPDRRFGLILPKPLFGFLFGLALRLIFNATAFFLFALTRVGRLALCALR